MAPRPTWKGGMGFGMVNVPVKLFTATDEKTIHFNNIHRECKTKLNQPKVCPTCKKEVETKDMVKGYEVGDNQWVFLEDSDFAAVRLKSLKAMEVLEFVDGAGIDPRHYDQSYFVAPDEAGAKAFSLFLQAMAKVNMVGVVKLTFKTKEKLATIRAFGKVILLQTLFYADELKPAQDIQVALPEVSERELEMGMTLIKTLASGKADMTKYHDNYREALMKVIQAKVAGEVITVEAVPEEKPMDLVDALMASINAEQKKKETAGVA
ncbi:MAG: Ku protein [Dehalococcoidales bacterium]